MTREAVIGKAEITQVIFAATLKSSLFLCGGRVE